MLVKARNEIQATLVNGSRLHIPGSFSQEALHSGTKGGTVFPELVTQVRGVTFSFLCPLLEKYGTFIARCNALIEKVSPFIGK